MINCQLLHLFLNWCWCWWSWSGRHSQLFLLSHPFPPHNPTRDRKEQRADHHPGSEDPKILTQPVVRAEQQCPTRVHDLPQRPCITPFEKCRCQLQSIESSRNIRDDPEYKPKRRPRLTDQHGHILASETQCSHAYPIQHPIDDKGGVAKIVCIVCNIGLWP